MILLICIIVFYILPIFGVRYLYREFAKYGIWLAEDCISEWTWYVPICNIVSCLVLYLDSHYRRAKNKGILKYKSKILNKFFNLDLIN
jgi:hypothetical protein